MNRERMIEHTHAMLNLARANLGEAGFMEETGNTNVKGDRTIEMDVRIEEVLLDYVKRQHLPVIVFSEEIGTVSVQKKPQFLLVFDPLDGSTNYKIGKNLMPYGVLIAFYKGLTPKLKDVVVAGAFEQTSGTGWIFDGLKTRRLNGEVVKLQHPWQTHRSTPVYFDLYYSNAYKAFTPLAEKIHIRWSGSNIGSLLYVLTETAAAMGARQERAEEIGTMYALIKGAGGIVVDHRGQDLGEEQFDTQRTYQILAGSQEIVKFCVETLNKHKPLKKKAWEQV